MHQADFCDLRSLPESLRPASHAAARLLSDNWLARAVSLFGTGDAAQSREEMFNQIETEWTALCTELTEHGDLSGQRRSLLARAVPGTPPTTGTKPSTKTSVVAVNTS